MMTVEMLARKIVTPDEFPFVAELFWEVTKGRRSTFAGGEVMPEQRQRKLEGLNEIQNQLGVVLSENSDSRFGVRGNPEYVAGRIRERAERDGILEEISRAVERVVGRRCNNCGKDEMGSGF
jgi:hypothetical protein